MRITADISLYPLADDFTPAITDFILRLRQEPGLEVITNQLSTQVRGDFAAVTAGLDRCMQHSMTASGVMVFVVKYINADLPIGAAPRLGG
jgi:uncharacterized protein YqgV (UPF0045/DUF77 family)